MMLKDVAPCLDAMMDKKWGSNQWVDSGQFVFCASDGQKNASIQDNLAPTLTKQDEQPYVARTLLGKPNCSHAEDQETYVPAIGWSEELTAHSELAGTIQYGGQGGRHDGVMNTAMQVRRVTPAVKPVEIAPPKLPPAPQDVMVPRVADFQERLLNFFSPKPPAPTQ